MSVYVWGKNRHGQLGEDPGSWEDSLVSHSGIDVPTRLDIDDEIVAVAGGEAHTLIVSKFGDIYSFGRGREGQLGHGNKHQTALAKPTKVSNLINANVVSVACGAHHSLAVTASGRVYHWGLVHKDHRTVNNSSSPDGDILSLLSAAGSSRESFAQRVVGDSARQWLSANDEAQMEEQDPSEADLASLNQQMAGVFVTRARQPWPTLLVSLLGMKVVSVSAGYAHSVVVTLDGRAFACGHNDQGQLGRGNRIYSRSFCLVKGFEQSTVIEVACGEQHNLARVVPKVESAPKDGDKGFTHNSGATAGGCYGSAVGADVYVWGGGRLGQLGLGNKVERLSPTLLEGLRGVGGGIVSVGAGSNHSMCVTRDGQCYGWGHAEYNQQGVKVTAGADLQGGRSGNHDYFRVPQKVSGLSGVVLTKVQCGNNSSLALDQDGNVYSFGWNSGGVLGRGAEGGHDPSPKSISTLLEVIGITSGYGHCAALTNERSMGRHLQSMLNYSAFADVKIRAPGCVDGVSCHLAIVSARCPALAGLMKAAMTEQVSAGENNANLISDSDLPTVDLMYNHASEESVELLVCYLYTDEVNCEVKGGTTIGMLGSLAQELLLPRLEAICASRLSYRERKRFLLQHTQSTEQTLLQSQVVVPNSSFVLEMDRLAGKEMHSDVHLVVSSWNWRFPSHKAILCNVEYWKALLAGGFREGLSDEVDLSGFEAEGVTRKEAIEAVIRYIYTNCDSVVSDMNLGLILEVVICAGMMGVTNLVQACDQELTHHIEGGQNVKQLAEYASCYDLPKLAFLCKEILQDQNEPGFLHSNAPLE